MSPIGRIFIVLNLILAAAFLGWASNTLATSHEYKQKFEDELAAKQQLEQEKDEEISTLRAARSDAENNAALLREERDREKLRADQAGSDLKDSQTASAELRSSVTRISEELAGYNETNSRLLEEKDRAVQARFESERERDSALAAQLGAETSQADAEEAVANANRRIDDFEVSLAGMTKARDSLQTQLDTLVDVTGVTLAEITSQKLIEGTVVQAMYDVPPGLVALNVGEENDVKRGMTFEIFRGKAYKGQVRIESVRARMSTARILRTVDGQRINQGDSASTRL